jgi:hypothetical protein
MGLVFALFVGCLAWRVVFYAFCGVIALVIKYPKWVFGTIGAGIALFVALIAGFLIWVTYFDRPSIAVAHYDRGNWVVSAPTPTQQGLSPQGEKVLDDFLKDKAQQKPSPLQPDPYTQKQYDDWVKAQKNKPVTVRRAELVKP